MSSLRRLPASAIALSVALVLYATLTPGAAAAVGAAHWQFTVGETPLTDACSNVLLFVPFGVALVIGGVGVGAATMIGLVLSLAIELLQSTGHPAGRYATYADLVANSAGAALGAVIAASRARWMRPNARDAKRLAIGWTGMAAVVVTLTAWLLSPIHRDQRNTTPPTRSTLDNAPGYPWFAGTVIRVVVSGVDVPQQGTGPARVVAPTGARDVVVLARGRDSRSAFMPLLYLHDARDTIAYMMVGQFGDDAVVRSPRRGDRFGLRMPQLVLSGMFSSTATLRVGVRDSSTGDVAIRKLVATVSSQRLTMQQASPASAVVSRLDLTPSLGWLMVQPVIGDDEASRTLGTIAWLFLLVAPACFWSWRCDSNSRRATGVVLGAICSVFVASPIVFAVAPLPLWQWGTLLAAAMFGVFCSRLTNSAES